ncbi:hypothetical protein [Serratia sp. 2723]|uniref:hypothetical protein n=1 Tax=unclassified Serratia (in: enterobacteria) TaxID=2647522 RepID=UPI003D20837A
MSDIVVVFGAGGTVGIACVEALLRQGERVLATGRNLALLRSRLAHVNSERLSLAELDVLAVTPWPEVVRGCCRFIQCAGPSFALTERVIEQLMTQCVGPGVFIEVGGDAAAIERWHTPLAAAGWLGIFGAGVQPGLVGVAIRALGARFSRTDSLRVVTFTGGLQPLTPAGLAEYLQAVNDRTGHPGRHLQQGEWHKVVDMPSLPACFPPSAGIHPYVDEEAAYAAKELSLLSLASFNVTDSVEITRLLSEIMVLGEIPGGASQRIADAMTEKAPYFCLSAEGISDGQPEHGQHTVLTCTDSYQVTGSVAAWAMGNTLAPLSSSGANWFSQRPESLAIWQQWQTQPPAGVRIVWQGPNNSTNCEEGEL